MVVIPSTLSDHPSLVGVVRFPKCTYETNEVQVPLVIKTTDGSFMSLRQVVDMAHTIRGEEKVSSPINIPKNSITDFHPYTYYVLTDGETEPLIMQPQFLPNTLTIKGKFALSHQPIERYYPSMYKGDTRGHIYNITNLNQMMLPTATNEGLAYMNANANTIAQNRNSIVSNNLINGVSSVINAMVNPMTSGNIVSTVANGITTLKDADARNNDMMMTPNSIKSFGTPSTRQAFGNDNVRLLKYTVSKNIKNKILNFVDRYGNKYNNYATIDLKTYKGYIKFISPDIDSKIDNNHLQKIISILERGIKIE